MSASGFASEAVSETLGRATDVDSCVALVTKLNGLMTQAFEHFSNDDAGNQKGVGDTGIACRRGCNFCCHLRVMVLPHEAIALFRYLGSRMPAQEAKVVRERILANADEVRNRERAGQQGGRQERDGDGRDGHGGGRAPSRIACAFLIDGKCSAYEARPAACAGYHSMSKARCQSLHESTDPSADAIPMLESLRYVAATLDEGVEHAVTATGLNATRAELHTALAALIKNPGLIQKWRAGRPLIASAVSASSRKGSG